MKYTNKLGLPSPIYNAIAHDGYSRGNANISVTELINPPRIRALRRDHDHELEVDVSECGFMLLGTLLHELLCMDGVSPETYLKRIENAEAASVTEQQLTAKVGDWVISGTFDRLYFDGQMAYLQDWKLSSVWGAILDRGAKSEYIAQLNVYRWLCAQHGLQVDALQNIMVFRDWSKREAERKREYPQHQFMIYNNEVWSIEQTEAYIKERIAIHKASETSLPLCNDEERMSRPGKYVVKKRGNKKATKLCDSREEAERYIKDHPKKGPFEPVSYREGEHVRCQSYCDVAQFCEQAK